MTTMLNLLRDPWIVALTFKGNRRLIAPWQVTEDHGGDDPPIALGSERPDFRISLQQFLIGLLQTAASPARVTGAGWAHWLYTPPSSAELRELFEPYAEAFELAGDGPCFMQDLDPLVNGNSNDIAALLIDSPGGQGIRNNADFFVKRGRVSATCPACTAAALFTLQTNAPAGGSGVRTSLRGGGPLTTLVVADPAHTELQPTLWHSLWLNVVDDAALTASKKRLDPSVFPWLAVTRTSEAEGGMETTPEDAHALQAYWAMPRRIRINWDEVGAGKCDLCGNTVDVRSASFRSRPRGTNYTGPWRHPLSPYYRSAPDEPPLPVHPRPGGIGYRHWLSLVAVRPNAMAATTVTTFVKRARAGAHAVLIVPRLHVTGYDMDNMKPRNWYEASMPLMVVDESAREHFEDEVARLIDAATQTAMTLRLCTRDAWADDAPSRADLHHLDVAFYERTEAEFFAQTRRLKDLLEAGAGTEECQRAWYRELNSKARRLFAHWAAPDGFEHGNPRRVARAHKTLNRYLTVKLKTLLGLGDEAKEASA